jgi:hypothetical protein
MIYRENSELAGMPHALLKLRASGFQHWGHWGSILENMRKHKNLLTSDYYHTE